MFNPLHSITNQELFKKHKVATRMISVKKGSYHMLPGAKLTLFAVSKDEWDTKEDTGKSMKNALYVLVSQSLENSI